MTKRAQASFAKFVPKGADFGKKGPKTTTAKHGKRHERRVYSSDSRPSSATRQTTQGAINPDLGMEVVVVCGASIRHFAKKSREPVSPWEIFPHRGAALLYAQEQEARFRKSLNSPNQ